MAQETQQTAVVATFDSHRSAESAILALHHEGLDLKRLSIDGNAKHAAQHTLDSLNTEQFLVLVHGTAAMIAHARAVLRTADSVHIARHAAVYASHIAARLVVE